MQHTRTVEVGSVQGKPPRAKKGNGGVQSATTPEEANGDVAVEGAASETRKPPPLRLTFSTAAMRVPKL